MLGGKISKLVIVITSKDTGENLERWQFDVQLMGKATKNKQPASGAAKENDLPGSNISAPAPEKTEKEIQEEVQSLFRQITASVTFLPMLDGRCTFNVLVYADGDAEVPMEWGDSDAREIVGGEKVTLRSWGTSSHKVDTLVSYRFAD
jgi:mitotic spindle assembly checkpoint protein MAD2